MAKSPWRRAPSGRIRLADLVRDRLESDATRAIASGYFEAAGSLLPRRALVCDGPWLAEITDVLLGTGRKPVVILAGELRERAAAEGVPVIIDAGSLRCLDAATEQLLI